MKIEQESNCINRHLLKRHASTSAVKCEYKTGPQNPLEDRQINRRNKCKTRKNIIYTESQKLHKNGGTNINKTMILWAYYWSLFGASQTTKVAAGEAHCDRLFTNNARNRSFINLIRHLRHLPMRNHTEHILNLCTLRQIDGQSDRLKK